MQYFVYVIGINTDLEEPYTNCYIGVTKDLKYRWNSHKKSEYRIGQFIRKNSLTYDNMKVIFIGTDAECFTKEKELRFLPNMGLNEAIGGKGGYTAYDDIRNNKISKALKGRDITWGNKISKTRLENNASKGSSNPRAQKWKLIDPNGQEFLLNGNFYSFCEEHNLNWAALKRCVGYPVGNISSKFRDYGNIKIREKRVNTIGWTLIKEKTKLLS